jgi:hypothetical protein
VPVKAACGVEEYQQNSSEDYSRGITPITGVLRHLRSVHGSGLSLLKHRRRLA